MPGLPLQAQSALGLLAMAALAWALGGFARPIPWRVVVAGLAAQVALGALLLWVPPVRAAFGLVGDAVGALATATRAGTSLVFGHLGGGPLPYAETAPGASFVLFFSALPLVLVVGALSALLYHWRVLPLLVRGASALLRRAFGVSGACGVAVGANVFVGMVEAPLLVRAWLARLSTPELFAVMAAGLATISGNTLVVYATLLAPVVPDAAGQLLAASLVSAPAAVLVALLMRPPPRPGDAPAAAAATGAEEEPEAAPPLYDSAMDAVVRGTQDGLNLMLAIMAFLVVFVALAALVDLALAPLTGLTLRQIAGWLLWPLAVAMGVPTDQAGAVAASLGTRLVVNEFVAYLDLATGGGPGLDARSRLILAWALCGFANLGSVGIMVGGMSAMCPGRRAEIVRLGLPALAAGTLACCMTGAVVGMLTPP